MKTDLLDIRNCDCMDLMREYPSDSVDIVITDPPYGINTKSDGKGKLNPWADLCNSAYWYAAWIAECRRILKPTGALWTFLNWRSIVTFQKASCDIRWPITSMAIWDKAWIGPGGNRGLRPSYEMVALFAMQDFCVKDRGQPDIFRAKWSAHKPNGHPAEKPEAAIEWIMDASDVQRGDIVCDIFMGSGTTGAVAVRRGARFVGSELDGDHYNAACERIKRETAQTEFALV